MSLGLSIISSEIISDKFDHYWNHINDLSQSNGVKLLVITSAFNNLQEEQQLQKIIQACQLTENESCTLTIDKSVAWHKIREAVHPQVVLLLGVHPYELGISALFHVLAPNNFDGCLWLVAPSLSEMEKYNDVKKQLWTNGLKPIFIDKTITIQ